MNRFLFNLGVTVIIMVLFLTGYSFATISCGDTNRVCVVSGTENTSATFIDSNTYVINGAVTFTGVGTVLTINPGTVIKYTSTGSLAIGTSASVIADGNATNPIIITSCKDQNFGINVSTVAGCSGGPAPRDYTMGLQINSDSAMTINDNLSYLKVLYPASGIYLSKDINSIHDSNFSYVKRNVAAAYAITFNVRSTTKLYNNVFDLNSAGTASSAYGILTNYDFNGEIYNNTFYAYQYAISINGANLNNAIFKSDIHDNNFFINSAYALYIDSPLGMNGKIYSNFIDINLNIAITNYGAFFFNRGTYTGEIYSNQIRARGQGSNAPYVFRTYTTTGLTFIANIHHNIVYDSNYTRIFYLRHPGIVDTNIYSNRMDLNIGAFFDQSGSSNQTGDIYDNNFSLDGNYLVGNQIIIIASSFTGNIYRNYFWANYGTNIIQFNAALPVNSNIYDNNIIDTNRCMFLTSVASTFTGDIHHNTFDLNASLGGVDWSTVGNGQAIYFSRAYSGNIYNNSVKLKQYALFFWFNGNQITGSIRDNNFFIERGSVIAHTSATDFVDINSNNFISLPMPPISVATASINYIFNQTISGASFSKSFYNNKIIGVKSPRVFTSSGLFSGNISNNLISDFNSIPSNNLMQFGSTLSGKIFDNNFYEVGQSSSSNGGNLIYINVVGDFTGEIYNNNFSDLNSDPICTTAVSQIFMWFSGSNIVGTIRDNNMLKVINLPANCMVYAINYSGTGLFSPTITRNTFYDWNWPKAASSYNYLISTSGTNTANIYNNTFGKLGRTYIQYTVNGTVNSNFYDNNIYDLNMSFLYAGVPGIFGGKIYNNTIKNAVFSTVALFYVNGGEFKGEIYNNKFLDLNYSQVLSNGGIFSGRFYNNLINSGSTVAVNLIVNTGIFLGDITNNTFYDFNKAANIALYNNGGVFTGRVQNNLFAWGRTGISANNRIFEGTFSNNAYWGVQNQISGTTGYVTSITDKNVLTGFTQNPFDGNNLDRNFLLNDDLNGGGKLINEGATDTNTFFGQRTTRPNNSLDRGIIDIGYHYDQNAPYLAIVSPNGGESVSGTQRVDFNVESSFGASALNMKLYYSSTTEDGTEIIDSNLSNFTCAGEPIYQCSYSWDASDIRDGNYYLIILGTFAGGSGRNNSTNTFTVISIPKVSLKTYLGGKARGFFGDAQDVNLIVRTNSGIPTITITAPDGNIVVNSVLMNDITNSDMNTYQYTYTIDSNYGWYDVKISGKTFEDVFYHSREWISQFVDYNSTTFPFSMDLNITEPGINDRWFWLFDIPVTFAYGADENAVRVIEYSPTDSKYLEIPVQISDVGYSSGNLTSAKLSTLISIQKGETKSYFVTYSKDGSSAEYYPDSNLSILDNNYVFENSLFKTIFALSTGGLLSEAFSKIGTNTPLAGYAPISLAPEAKSGLFTYSATQESAPIYSTDINGAIYSKFTIRGNNGDMDYNITYHLYAKQPYYIMDLNVRPTASKTWTYLYDDYFAQKENIFSKYSYYINNTLATADINISGTSAALNFGDANYWGSYKKSSGDAYGSISLQRNTPSYSVATTFNDESAYEYTTRKIYAGAVTVNSFFGTKSAKSIFNPWNNAGDLNELYYGLVNPLTYVMGAEVSGDRNAPIITSYSYSPLDLNDSTDINFSITATDNIEILYVDINADGNGLHYNERQNFSSASINTNLMLPATVTNAGHLDVNLIVTDIAANITVQNFLLTLGDTTPPRVVSFRVSPDTNENIDPLKSVLFDLNVAEYTSISSAKLMVRDFNRFDSLATWSDWTEYDLNLVSQNDYNYYYDYNYILPTNELVIEAKTRITDANAQVTDSNTLTIYNEYDYTWTLSSSTFTAVSAMLDTNATVEDFTITNTGDKNLLYSITSNWDYTDKVFFNERRESDAYSFTVNTGDDLNITTVVTAKSTERTDTLSVTINPIDSRAAPDNNTFTGTLISFANGPFMFLEMTTYPTAVTQGDTLQTFALKSTNKGNQSAAIVDYNWVLPDAWSVTSGALISGVANLGINQSITKTIVVTVGASATTGTQTVSANATPDSNNLKTKSISVNVTVQSSGGDDGYVPPVVPPAGTGGNPGGGSGGGGGGALPFTDTSQKDTFFQTSEVYELVRGQDSSFKIKFTNPLKNRLEDIRLSVEGILSNYLELKNNKIARLDSNKSAEAQINILSPKYFNPGSYELKFTILGNLVLDNNKKTSFKEVRLIKLLIHDTNKQVAESYLVLVQGFIDEAKKSNFKLRDLPALEESVRSLIKSRDYDGAKEKYLEAKLMFDNATDAAIKTQNISGLIALANTQGISTPSTNRLLALSQLAIQRGDYALALSRLKEAELTYSLETKGEFNFIIWALGHLDSIALMLFLFVIALYLFTTGVTMLRIDSKLKEFNSENNLLLGLIKALQEKTFVENKTALGEYYDAMGQFENRIAEISEGIVELTTKKNNTFTFSAPATRLKQERKTLLDLIREMQKQYFNMGLIETRIYQTKTSSLTKRLSEVEEQIVHNDLKKTIRTNTRGPTKYLWKAYYKIMK